MSTSSRQGEVRRGPPADRSEQEAEQRDRVAAFRRAYDEWAAPIGTRVLVTRDDGSTFEGTTASTPWLVGSGIPLIALQGYEGGLLLTRVRVLAPATEGAT